MHEGKVVQLNSAARDVVTERQRQVEGEMSDAAAAAATCAGSPQVNDYFVAMGSGDIQAKWQ